MFVIALAEAELSEGHNAEAFRLASAIKARVNSGEKIAENVKQRSDALIARLGSLP